MKFQSPGKINHFLHILGRRKEGYHNLQTLFQYLDYGDTLTFNLLPMPKIILNTSPPLPFAQEKNLIYRVAGYLQRRYRLGSGIEIDLEKKLPMGGGLGGGSSNAATTLLVLNYVWELNLNLSDLLDIGAQFGADIPCFILGHSAWGEGTGTTLTKANPKEKWVLVVTPPCSVATPKIYQHPELTRNTSPFRIEALEELLENERLEQAVRNDFEVLVCQLYPEVADCLAWLNQYGQAKLSGSGSSVFALFESEQVAQDVIQQLPSIYQGFVAKGVNQSPLHQQLINLNWL